MKDANIVIVQTSEMKNKDIHNITRGILKSFALIVLKLNSVALLHKWTIPTGRSTYEISANFADRGCLMVRATDPHDS
jgi:hypothetical protein